MILAVVIPAYNEAATIKDVIRKIPKKIDGVTQRHIIVVDDNSSDDTSKIAREAGAHVISHKINLGAGGATLTGIIFARRLDADLIITLDGDGQHDPEEVINFIRHQKMTQPDLLIGSRFLSSTIGNMPLIKKLGNKFMSSVTYLLSGQAVSDSQSGYRLLSRRFADILAAVDLGGYEFCSETIMIAKQNNLSISEIPIKTIYHDGRRGQNPLNGVNILIRLIYRKLVG